MTKLGAKMRYLAIVVAFALMAPAHADQARPLGSGNQLQEGYGAVRISIRSQLQYGAPLYVWFVREGEDPANPHSAVRFERTQGVPFAGTNMIDSRPQIFGMKVGRYRLAAHVMQCKDIPRPDQICMVFGSPVPTGTYPASAVIFEVAPYTLTDVGELVLELPADVDVGYSVSYKQAYKKMPDASVKWRKIAAPLPEEWASLKRGPTPSVSDAFRSNITCEVKPNGVKGMSLLYPFTC